MAIPILQTRKLSDCRFPKAVFLARSLEIKSSEIAAPGRICTYRPDSAVRVRRVFEGSVIKATKHNKMPGPASAALGAMKDLLTPSL